MGNTFKIRRGTENTMKTIKSNTVLAAGEIFAEVPNTGVGTGKGRLVMGDGVTTYNDLPSFIENTDVSNTSVTITADNSTTSSAALNNVTSGASTGALIGSLKQAITLTKSELIGGSEYLESSTKTTVGGIDTFTFTNALITANGVYDFYCDVYGVAPSDVVVSSGTMDVKFNSSDNVTTCRVYIK